MNDKSRPSSRDLELEAAAQWWASLRGEHTQEQAAEWLQWSSADTRHADAFERVAELGAQLGALDARSKADLLAEFAPTPVRRRRAPWLAAAAVIATMGLGVAWLSSSTRASYASDVGENRNIVLDDGSRLALGGASSVQTQFGVLRRDVELSAGEAFFDVAHDTRRPFTVQAGELSVRAVGTAFEVRRDAQRVTVAVTEGKVRIAGATPGFSAMEASAGQQVIYDPVEARLLVSTIDPAHAATWRERRLEFVDESLAAVVARINRYDRRPLQLTDPTLGTLVFTGSVRLDDIDGWLEALPAVFPVDVTVERDRILISHRAANTR